eukprot:COSAG02_NODE_18726_length_922_cov_5.517618_3_plen_31_part_01
MGGDPYTTYKALSCIDTTARGETDAPLVAHV